MTPLQRPTLYELRTHAGFATQARMAARLGVSTDTYGNIERGKTNPAPATAKKLARVLRVSEALLREVLG